MKGYEYLARILKGYGTTHVFYQEFMLFDTIKEAERLGIKPILAHSEFAAGYMADGYARVKMQPGICMAQSVGAANLAASIHDAWLGTTPVLAFTGKKPPFYQNRNAYQESPHHYFFDGVTKLNLEIQDPIEMPRLVRQSLREAVTGKPRPVHLEVQGFTGADQDNCEITEDVMIDEGFLNCPPIRLQAPSEDIHRAADAIDKSKKPVLVLGRGALVSGAGKEAVAIAEKCGIWITTTPDGKTLVDESHPLWAGIVGFYGMNCANKIVQAADLVIFVGTQTSDQTTLDWTVPLPSVKTIQIDIDAAELGRSYPHCIGLQGDAKTVIGQLAGALRSNSREDWIKQGKAFTADTFARHEELWESDSLPIKTERLCKEISDALPDDAILVADTGWSAVWSATMIRMKQSQFYTRAAGSLGWGFPASLGAKCAAPDRPVVCFTGDGGFMYLNTEMETSVRYGINTVTIINNNRSLAQCVPTPLSKYPDEEEYCRGRLSFTPVSFAKIAEAYGLFSIQVEKPEEIGPAIKNALASGRPALVEVLTNPIENYPLPSLEK